MFGASTCLSVIIAYASVGVQDAVSTGIQVYGRARLLVRPILFQGAAVSLGE